VKLVNETRDAIVKNFTSLLALANCTAGFVPKMFVLNLGLLPVVAWVAVWPLPLWSVHDATKSSSLPVIESASHLATRPLVTGRTGPLAPWPTNAGSVSAKGPLMLQLRLPRVRSPPWFHSSERSLSQFCWRPGWPATRSRPPARRQERPRSA